MSVDPVFDAAVEGLSGLTPARLAAALVAIDDAGLRERLTAHFQIQTTEAANTTAAELPPTRPQPSGEIPAPTTAADTAVQPASAATDTTPTPATAEPPPNDHVAGIRPGTRIGAYTVDAWVGDGGSASVYRGHRLVEGMRQTVAIKVLRVGLHAVEVRQQFDRERRVLSMLEHGSIARWIDGGVTREGLAYLVLEYVDGQSITSFARARQLSMQARIELMIEVASAVDAAHRALIVHRDLKPGNLMVNEAGQVKLLDFGIAKLLQAEAEQQTQVQMYTPAYAAPEQRDGGPITTTTDVYALGVILGELLTGKRFSSTTSRSPSLEVDDQPPEPGTLPAPPGRLRQLLKGDLDNILLKALAADPAQRYPSAAAFAEDLRRALDGRPVLAHPPSAGYRIRPLLERLRERLRAVSRIGLWQIHYPRSDHESLPMKWFHLLPDFFKGPVIRLDDSFEEAMRLWRRANYSLGIREDFLIAKILMEERGLNRLTGRMIFPRNHKGAIPELCNFAEWPNLALSSRAREFFVSRGNDFYIEAFIENLDLVYHVFRPGLELNPFPNAGSFRKSISGISVPSVTDIFVQDEVDYFRLPKEFEVAGSIYVNESIKKAMKKLSLTGAVFHEVATGRESR